MSLAVEDETSARGFGPIVTISVLFFIFGFATWLNGPLIMFVKLAFDLDDVNALLVPMAFYLSYFFFALPSSALLRRVGMKRGMAIGLLVMAFGAVAFGQFTTARYYPGTLVSLFVIGTGLSLLQTASNPYVCVLGPADSAARRIAFMGICNKFAGFLAPLVFGVIALQGLDHFDQRVQAAETTAARDALLDTFARQVYLPYMVMAALLAALAVWILFSRLPDIRSGEANTDTGGGSGSSFVRVLRVRHLRLGVICLFLYVGLEVLAADGIGIYGAGFQLPLDDTRFFTSYTLLAMLIGYVAGVLAIPRYISQHGYLAISAALGVLLTIAATLTSGFLSVAFIASLGFANAMMWPAIFPLAIRDLGRDTETGSAFLIMAIVGGALMPYAFALIKEHIDFQIAYLVLAGPAYLYILFYGLNGWRPSAD
ncbi:glucose/galactose MFS transporter [Hyphomicrobium methylovorum]|uniref:sugar MFS transporter n=1 Tax=Hyphomicrobium methylovorum TaxID=84 RepID=UPI0015E6CFC2|nr:sugar MFS transporter [Hyphomicrobium methylovorum]MBA2126849.1 glucose/galactose MFS transporter [Hyphomicrobium methylovorum]